MLGVRLALHPQRLRNGESRRMSHSKKTAAFTAALTIAAGGFVSGTATANASVVNAASGETRVVVGAGSPMRMPFPSNKVVEGRHLGSPMCSLGVPGTIIDQNGVAHRVIMTAGHCVTAADMETGETVTGQFFIPTKDGDKLLSKDFVGTDVIPDENSFDENTTPAQFVNSLFNSPDYGIIEVQDDIATTSLSQSVNEFGINRGEPAQIVGVDDKPTLGEMEISFDNLGEPVCTDGSRTGRGCGVQVFRVRNGIWAISPINHGDSGGNAYNPETHRAVGINSMSIGPISRFQPVDVALEEQYGIPDGQVNDRFRVESATDPQSQFRTIDEDSKFNDVHRESGAPKWNPKDLLTEGADIPPKIAEVIPYLPDLPDLPGLPELPTLPETPGIPNLKDFDSPALPGLDAPVLPGVGSPTLPDINKVMEQAGMPSFF